MTDKTLLFIDKTPTFDKILFTKGAMQKMKKVLICVLAVIIIFIGAMPLGSAKESIQELLIIVTSTTIKWIAMGTVIYFTCKFWYTRDKKKSEREQDRQDG